MDLRFRKRGWCATWFSLYISLSLFVSLVLAFVRYFAMAIDDMLRLVVCWNHILDGVTVWWVSPYESLSNSLHTSNSVDTVCVEDVVMSLLQMCML